MTKLADQKQRDAIRNDLDMTMLVEAAAGTGKTTSLIGRMVSLVRTKRARPSTIAAITFTVKAAAQLRERFQQALEEAGETDAIAEIDRGFIGTTHAFCARLLRERPVEAGLDPEFEELDEVASRMLALEYWTRWFDIQVGDGNPVIAEARAIGLDRKVLRETFVRLVDHSDVTIESHPVARPDLAGLCTSVAGMVREAAAEMPDPPDYDCPFQRLLVRLRDMERSSDLEDDLEAQLAYLGAANHASTKATQKRWADGKRAKARAEAYGQFVDQRLRPELVHWKEYLHGVAMKLLAPAVSSFAAERRRNGTLTFQDLLICARDLLRDHPQVRRYFQRRFTHLLVDEFQDTDPLQAEVMFFLTGEDAGERNWRKLRPRPGSLFIVGDPKQSIYRFRRADITTYLDVKQRMEKVVELSTNFRSAPVICSFVNETFTTLFTADDIAAGRQASHIDLVPGAGDEGTIEPDVVTLQSPDLNNDGAAEAEAAFVAKWISDAVAAGTHSWGDFLLVGWSRPRLSYYAEALERASVPYAVTGSRAFEDAANLRQVLPLLKAVAEPDDMVSLVAFLRGPLCGADDDALYRFVESGGRFRVFSDPPAGTDERIASGLALVRDAVAESTALPPAATMARIIDRVGLMPLAASGERGGTRTGSVMLALALAREESARGESFPSIVGQLESLLEAPGEIEELDADPSPRDAVRLMNLHQVKGLEAPVVFLIDPADAYQFPVDVVIDRTSEDSRGHFVIKSWQKDPIGLPRDWAARAANEKLFKDAEARRLLYVAATRARRMLVVGYRTTNKGISGAWRDLATRITRKLAPHKIAAVRHSSTGAGVTPLDVRTRIAGQFATSTAPSYSVMPVTKIAHDTHEKLVKAEEGLGKGTSWGRVLHRLFEAMLRDESLDIRLYAGNLLKDEERDPVELEEVMRVVGAVQSSPLWARVKAADERYVEIPFALTVPWNGGETLLHGTIDLVFREGAEWYIVDYKSDSTANRLESLVTYYKPQVEHYVRFWSELTGAPAHGGLFFVDGCVERWLTGGATSDERPVTSDK